MFSVKISIQMINTLVKKTNYICNRYSLNVVHEVGSPTQQIRGEIPYATYYLSYALGRTEEVPHDDVIKWKHFPRNWPFVWEIHRSPVNFPHKGQWRGALMFSLIYAWINDWVNNREAGDLRRQHGHYDVIVMAMHLVGQKRSLILFRYYQ